MAKRSPYESYHRRQRAANSKVLDIWFSKRHPCVCSHPQGFHHNTDAGENVGSCVDADCGCTAFDEDTFAAARLAAGVLPANTPATADEAGGDDALTRTMRAQEQREVSAEETWDQAVHAKRSNPIGKPRPETVHNPAAMDALRELGGHPDDLHRLRTFTASAMEALIGQPLWLPATAC